ncbi:MAG TPA: hypothetical protein VLL51_06375 [Gemmatimonadales bacterium]|nr:hypothetical protein [Gemmatimonadales bacterium]
MLHRWRLQIRAFLLAAFLAGGAGIPGLDALLYHQTEQAGAPLGPHFEDAGAVCHQDTCLAAFSSARLADLPRQVTGPTVPVLLALAVQRSDSPSISSARPPQLLPRSPPVA